MLKSSDAAGRLRLFRYGLIVVVVITFIVSLLTPYATLQPFIEQGLVQASLTDFLDEALLYTVIVAVIAVIAYFVYANLLRRSAE
jgi:hypothetical protein